MILYCIERPPRSWIPTQKHPCVSLGRLLWSLVTSHRGPGLYKPPSTKLSQVFLRTSTQPVELWRQFPSRASTCLSFATWKLKVLAAPAFLRSLSQNSSEAADAPPHRFRCAHIGRVQVLARENHGAFFPPTAASASCKGNGRQAVPGIPSQRNTFLADILTSALYSGIQLEYGRACRTSNLRTWELGNRL